MLMVVPVLTLTRKRIPASRLLPRFMFVMDFNCTANFAYWPGCRDLSFGSLVQDFESQLKASYVLGP